MQRKVAIAGGSGLVGSYILQGLLADPSVKEVHALGRRPLNMLHSKLKMHVSDLSSIPPLPLLDEVYLAVGTTIRTAGSQAAFRRIDFEANLAIARAAIVSGANRIGLVSAIGADKQSKVFYNRVKGELEYALGQLETEALVIARPSLLLGDRKALGQHSRLGEKVAAVVLKAFNPIVPFAYRPIEARKVAQALLLLVPSITGSIVLSSKALLKYGCTVRHRKHFDRQS